MSQQKTDRPVEPVIYDVVKLPESEGQRSCPLANGPIDDIEICEQPVEYVFVYEASVNDEDDRRRNCLACSDCVPSPTDLVTDGGENLGNKADFWIHRYFPTGVSFALIGLLLFGSTPPSWLFVLQITGVIFAFVIQIDAIRRRPEDYPEVIRP